MIIKNMLDGMKYIFKENISNAYRIASIVKYELIEDARESKFGFWWSFINPFIYIATYWFVFGLGIRGGSPVDGVPFFEWMIVGLLVWFFMSAAIRTGVTAITSKMWVLKKMKFPIPTLLTINLIKEIINHLIMYLIVYLLLMVKGVKPNFYNIEIIYYMFSSICFTYALSLNTAVLNVYNKDVKKGINSCLRMLMYMTPILWSMEKLPKFIQNIMACNPIFYIVQGYRDTFYFKQGIFAYKSELIFFWIITCTLFISGSYLLYKNRYKIIDRG